MAAPAAEPARPFDLDRLGPRARRRAEPRASIAVGAAGCALAVLGGLIVGMDAADDGGNVDLVPGLLLMGALVAAGFVAQARFRRGPIAAAGTVGVLLAVPPFLLFALRLADDSAGLLPIVVLSALVWGAAYLVGSGQGRPAYLGAAALAAWVVVLDALGDLERLPYYFFPVFALSSDLSDSSDLGFGSDSFFRRPDLTTTALLSLAVGIAYVALSRRLDRRGGAGAATPLLVAGIPALVVGAVLLVDEMEVAGAGLVLLGIGVVLALHGADVGRRATTWIGGWLVVGGLGAMVGDASDDAAVAGGLMLVVGIAVVAGAHRLAVHFQEPDELPEPVVRRRLVARPDPDADADPDASEG